VSRLRGFTLIEVMIALTLLSMIMVAIIAAMRTFGNTKATIQQVTNRVDEIRVVSEFLRKTIGSAMPVLQQGGLDPA
jgi:general secretion pathway protein J